MTEKFDWTDRDTVVVSRQDALAVYLNPEGNMVIRRERNWDEDEDVFIVIDRRHVPHVAQMMLRLLENVDAAAS